MGESTAPRPQDCPDELDAQGRKTGEWTAFNPDGTVRKTTRHRPRK